MSTGGHTLTPSRSHARRLPRFPRRLLSVFRDREDLPAQDFSDGQSITEAMAALPAPAFLSAFTVHAAAPPWAGASEPGQPAGPDDRPWNGQTLTDPVTPSPRPFVPELPDPDVESDLGGLVIFRDAVRSAFVRQEEARGFRAPGVPWEKRYAGLYRARTALPAPQFGIADAAIEAHEAAKDAVAADVLARIRRVSADADRGTGAAA